MLCTIFLFYVFFRQSTTTPSCGTTSFSTVWTSLSSSTTYSITLARTLIPGKISPFFRILITILPLCFKISFSLSWVTAAKIYRVFGTNIGLFYIFLGYRVRYCTFSSFWSGSQYASCAMFICSFLAISAKDNLQLI